MCEYQTFFIISNKYARKQTWNGILIGEVSES